MSSIESDDMTNSQADQAYEEAEAMVKAAGAMPPPISKQPTPDWLDKKNHPALANPLAGAAGRGGASLPLQPTRKPSAATAAANQLGGMGIASQGESGTGGTAQPLQGSGISEDTLIEDDDDFGDEVFATFAKQLRYQAIDVNYNEKIDDKSINLYMVKEKEFKKAGLTFFDCVNASSGKITVTSLTNALKDSKKKSAIVETSMSQIAAANFSDDDDAEQSEAEVEEANSDDEHNRYADYPPLGVDGINTPYLDLMKASRDRIDRKIGNLPNPNFNFNPNT